MKYAFTLIASLAAASPAWAQMDHSKMPGMSTPAPEPAQAPPPPAGDDPHAGHQPAQTPPQQSDMPAAPEADPHAGHDMDQGLDSTEIGSAPAPVPPDNHAADAVYGPEEMAAARGVLRYENGGMPLAFVSFDLAEVQIRNGQESYRWEGEAWTGGDINRVTLKYEGEGVFGGSIESAEFQLLWSRAIAPYWNVQTGVRQDLRPSPARTYFSFGAEGMAPYWFEVTGTAFVSNKGEVHLRTEGYYDLRITQSLILQPRIEANFSLQDIPQLGVGSGLVDFEGGLRLRYEIKREFAPYIGVEWKTKAGGTATYARLAGDDPASVSFVAGIKVWF